MQDYEQHMQRIPRYPLLAPYLSVLFRLDLHFEDPIIGAADFNVRVGIVHAYPLGSRGLSVGIRTQQNLTVFRDRARNPLELQGKTVEIGRTLRELDVVFAVIAACILLGQFPIRPRPHERQLGLATFTFTGD